MIRIKAALILILHAGLLGTASAQTADDPAAYVEQLRRESERVRRWTEEASKKDEKVKYAQLNQRSAELQGLISLLDQMPASPENEIAWQSAIQRFRQTYKEADVIANMTEGAAALMKEKKEAELLESSLADSKGVYTTESLSSAEFLAEDESARPYV